MPCYQVRGYKSETDKIEANKIDASTQTLSKTKESNYIGGECNGQYNKQGQDIANRRTQEEAQSG